jgi:hypothetical protein
MPWPKSVLKHHITQCTTQLHCMSQTACRVLFGICATRFNSLVVLAGGLHPIPFRTRPLNPPAPMVLRLKAWESRSPPGF